MKRLMILAVATQLGGCKIADLPTQDQFSTDDVVIGTDAEIADTDVVDAGDVLKDADATDDGDVQKDADAVDGDVQQDTDVQPDTDVTPKCVLDKTQLDHCTLQ